MIGKRTYCTLGIRLYRIIMRNCDADVHAERTLRFIYRGVYCTWYAIAYTRYALYPTRYGLKRRCSKAFI